MRLRALLGALWLLGATNVHAQSSGLLLGIASDSQRYRTLWIAPHADALKVVHELPGFIVPRADGFWRVDVRRGCSTDRLVVYAAEDTTLFINRTDELVREKIGEEQTFGTFGWEGFEPADQLSLDASCDSAEAELRRTYGRESEESDECYRRHIDITHVSPQLISFYDNSLSTEFCNPAKYYYTTLRWVVDFDGARQKLLHHLAPARAQALISRWEKAKGDCALEHSPDDSWGIVRGNGRWDAHFESSGAIVCRGDAGGALDFTEPVPAAFVRPEPQPRFLSALRKTPDVADFLVSPSADIIAVRRKNELSFYPGARYGRGAPLLTVRLPPGARVVMTEWATGRHVARWTNELRGLQAK